MGLQEDTNSKYRSLSLIGALLEPPPPRHQKTSLLTATLQ